MKNLILIFIITVIVFTGGYYSEVYLENSGKEIIDLLNEIESEIELGNMSNKEKVDEVENKWLNIKSMWNIITNHKDVDEIDMKFKKFKVYYNNQETVECLATISNIKLIIEDVPKAEEFNIINIL